MTIPGLEISNSLGTFTIDVDVNDPKSDQLTSMIDTIVGLASANIGQSMTFLKWALDKDLSSNDVKDQSNTRSTAKFEANGLTVTATVTFVSKRPLSADTISFIETMITQPMACMFTLALNQHMLDELAREGSTLIKETTPSSLRSMIDEVLANAGFSETFIIDYGFVDAYDNFVLIA